MYNTAHIPELYVVTHLVTGNTSCIHPFWCILWIYILYIVKK